MTGNQGSNNQLKSYPNVKKKHAYHLSSYIISSGQSNENNLPFSSKIADKTKKHRKDMKSCDDFIRPNNFKFMNFEWINQNSKMNAMTAFYANEKINQNVNQSNLMMFQQQLKLAMMKNSNIADTIGFSSNHGAMNFSNLTKNQSLLVFDQQSNSIVPLPNNFYSNMNKLGLSNKMAFTPANVNTKNIIGVSPSAYANGTFDHNHKQKPKKLEEIRKTPRYFQDKPAIKLNHEHADDITKTDTILLRLEDGPASINNINDPSNGSSIACEDLIHPSEYSITDSTVKKHGIKDSLNNRLVSGIKGIEIFRLNSDFDLNNRESESVIPEVDETPMTPNNLQVVAHKDQMMLNAMNDSSKEKRKKNCQKSFKVQRKISPTPTQMENIINDVDNSTNALQEPIDEYPNIKNIKSQKTIDKPRFDQNSNFNNIKNKPCG